MRIKVLSSSVDQQKHHFGATYLINETLAIDAGSLGFCSLAEQRRVRNVLLSHSHLDHLGSLPQFLDNVYAQGVPCPTVYGSGHVLDCLQRHFFNEQIWPDLARLSREESPFATFVELLPASPVSLEGLRVTPAWLHHGVPCMGFLLESDDAAVAFVSDTRPTDAIWNLARKCQDLRAVFLEASFPNAMAALAEKSMHLTPALTLAEYDKLRRDVALVAIHIKPAFHDQVVQELLQLGLPNLMIAEPNREYEF